MSSGIDSQAINASGFCDSAARTRSTTGLIFSRSSSDRTILSNSSRRARSPCWMPDARFLILDSRFTILDSTLQPFFVEFEQKGKTRAQYGEELLVRVAI